jgi:hypothetical protein
MVAVADTTTDPVTETRFLVDRRSGNPIGPDTHLLSDNGILLPFLSVSFDDTVHLTSSAAPFHTDLRLASCPRDHVGRMYNRASYAQHTPPTAPLSDLDLTHRDWLAAIDFLHNTMNHHAKPVHLASGKFPKACFALLHIQYEPRWLLKGHRSDENLFLAAKTITGGGYTHLDQVIRTSCIKHGENDIRETTKKNEYAMTNRTTGITPNTLFS